MRTSPPTLVRGYLRKGQSMVARLSEARPVTTGVSSEPVTLREFKSRREKAVSQGWQEVGAHRPHQAAGLLRQEMPDGRGGSKGM